jgi:hypothetical protein
MVASPALLQDLNSGTTGEEPEPFGVVPNTALEIMYSQSSKRLTSTLLKMAKLKPDRVVYNIKLNS